MSAAAAASGEEAKEPRTTEDNKNGDEASKDDDEWGKFYSMPPKWKKDATPSKSGLTDENIGHRLASLLRYHLDDTDGIRTDDDGWVEAADIIKQAEEVGLEGCTAEDLIRVAETNEHSTRGKRFDSDGAGRIKARYRHPPKDRRWDRDWRDRGRRDRGSRSRGYNSWQGWEDYGKWKEGGWQDQGDESWKEWKKPGFSPSPDDTIVKESTWADAEKGADGESATKASQAESSKVACDWEQWFTPEMVPYFYNTKTEEVFYPDDVAEAESKGWFRYVDTDGQKEGKIYWWHEASNASFYEEDAIGDAAGDA